MNKKIKKIVKKKAVKKVKKVVKKAVKKSAKRVVKKTVPAKVPVGKKIGTVTHFYGNISVGIVKFSKPVSRGTKVHFRGATTDFSQVIESMQFDHKEIDAAAVNQEVGMKVKNKVREGDEIFEA